MTADGADMQFPKPDATSTTMVPWEVLVENQ